MRHISPVQLGFGLTPGEHNSPLFTRGLCGLFFSMYLADQGLAVNEATPSELPPESLVSGGLKDMGMSQHVFCPDPAVLALPLHTSSPVCAQLLYWRRRDQFSGRDVSLAAGTLPRGGQYRSEVFVLPHQAMFEEQPTGQPLLQPDFPLRVSLEEPVILTIAELLDPTAKYHGREVTLTSASAVQRQELKAALCRLAYQDFLLTPYWRAVADKVKRDAAYRCKVCNSREFIQAHHRSYEHHGEEHGFFVDLVCLCDRCHALFHNKPLPPQIVVITKPAEVVNPTKAMVKAQARGQRKLLKLQLRRERLLLAETQSRIQLERNRRRTANPLVSPDALKRLCWRYRCEPEKFSGWSNETVMSVLRHFAVPIFAKPAMADEIAAVSPDEMMTVTKEDAAALRTDKGGFTGFTIKALGMQWGELKSGWVDRLVGSTMPRAQYLKALSGARIYGAMAKDLAT